MYAVNKVLCANINRMKKYFPNDYNFVPREFLYPEEKEYLEEYLKDNPDDWMIAKPSRGWGGEGIFLFKSKFYAPILSKEFVVQKYISNPLLIENKKFDLRLYVLIKNLEPLEAYFWNEGLVRFWTEDYVQPDEENIEQLYMHLTNFSLNKDNENYINPSDYSAENKGSKRLLSHFFNQLIIEEGLDKEYIKEQMLATIRKTIISMIPHIKAFTQKFMKVDQETIRCFQIIGIDIMLDENCQPWLMEANANPSLNMYLEKIETNGTKTKILSELDKHLKTRVLEDALKIVKSKDQPEVYGCFEKILPHHDPIYENFYIWEKARRAFTKLGGIKQPDVLTLSQFQKLGRYSTLTTSCFKKTDYEIIFKHSVRGLDSNYMDIESFFKAIEWVVSKMYPVGDPYENLESFLTNMESVLK